MHIPLLTTTLLSLGAAPDAPGQLPIKLSAQFAETELQVGEVHQIELTLNLPEGWSCTNSGMRSAMLQIEVPDCVTLSGKVLTEYRELSRNEFVQEPFEREIQAGTTTIEFTLTGEPTKGETISLNIVAYLNQEGSDEHHFLRKRLELPVKAGSKAIEGDASDTSWGEHDTLLVGDKADTFTLPQYGGTEINLDDYLGKKNIIVTTYRAHW
ncbi:MAG: hypothetical protein O7G85_02190 [Planctomycetota bacterium]|nr:hypothetical protein [Planctomycetota bacterium]